MAAGEIWVDGDDLKYRDAQNTVRTVNSYSYGQVSGSTGGSSAPSSQGAGHIVMGWFGNVTPSDQVPIIWRDSSNSAWRAATVRASDFEFSGDNSVPDGIIRVNGSNLEILWEGTWYTLKL